MSTTARLALPYIAPQQAQKQVTYNAAMALLDQLVQPSVKSRTTATPPATPAAGDAYIVPPAASGAWAGKDGRLAVWRDGGWSFATPGDGWLAYVLDTAEIAVSAAGAWSGFVYSGGAGLDKFGINMAADTTNRLALAADASLFSHAGADHRLKLDKASAGDTASLVFMDNASGRGEIGLTGDDALHLKVSPDGSAWIEALTVSQSSGVVSLPVGQLAFPATQNPSANAHTLDDYEEGTWTPVLTVNNSTTGITFGSPTAGHYTKIGNLVIAAGCVTLTSKGSSSGAAQIDGLPFAALSDGVYNAVAIGYASGFSGVTGAIVGMVWPGNSKVTMYQSNNGAAAAITNSQITNTTSVIFTASYHVA